jgi:hypothetical protein
VKTEAIFKFFQHIISKNPSNGKRKFCVFVICAWRLIGAREQGREEGRKNRKEGIGKGIRKRE